MAVVVNARLDDCLECWVVIRRGAKGKPRNKWESGLGLLK